MISAENIALFISHILLTEKMMKKRVINTEINEKNI